MIFTRNSTCKQPENLVDLFLGSILTYFKRTTHLNGLRIVMFVRQHASANVTLRERFIASEDVGPLTVARVQLQAAVRRPFLDLVPVIEEFTFAYLKLQSLPKASLNRTNKPALKVN